MPWSPVASVTSGWWKGRGNTDACSVTSGPVISLPAVARRQGTVLWSLLLCPTRVASWGVEGGQWVGVEGSQRVVVRPAEGRRWRRDVQLQRDGAVVVVVVNTGRPSVAGPRPSRAREACRSSGARLACILRRGGAGGLAIASS
ncbi:hypothetical protein E2C01_044865 [Portunus trituberculatus]|uniref:Uncharacterized protein n=1 Tax=Portunus trituberculatus TaxID=210409 RepID=A0A5B7G1M3_PORTR|nr:hypothetical protein [Portunus trituberculatus]